MNSEEASYYSPKNTSEIQLRAHHLVNLAESLLPYEVFTPEAIDEIVDREVQWYECMYYQDQDERYFAEDYLGENLTGRELFHASTTRVLQDILFGHPDILLKIDSKPDHFCMACQSTGEGQPGKHCLTVNQAIDLRILEELSKLVLEDNHALIHSEESEDGIVIPKAVIYNKEFLTSVINRTKPILNGQSTNNGNLASTSTP